MIRTATSILTFLSCALPAYAQGSIATLEGVADEDFFGASASGIGDVDGDTIPDYIIGAPGLPVINAVKGYAKVYSGATHAVIYTVEGAAVGDSFGNCVRGAGDVDDDGTPDFIVGARQSSFGLRRGYAQVFSGKTGLEIHKVTGSDGDNLGWSVAGVGDLNGDGFDDFAAGAPGAVTVNSLSQTVASGKVIVYSGKDKAVLATLKSEADGDRYGEAIAAIEDTNSDSIPDILVGLPGASTVAAGAGQVRLISGATFLDLHTVDGDNARDGLGTSVSSAGDVSGDTTPDFVAGAPFGNYARIFSGDDGSVIRSHAGASASDGMGQSVDGPGDIDGDCVPDVLIGAHFPPPFSNLIGAGFAKLFSGKDGTEILTVSGSANGDDFGSAVTGVGDLDKNGVPEFLVGASGATNLAGDSSGIAKLYGNGNRGPSLDGGAITTISLSAGGSQILSLTAGKARAGQAYLVMGTISGTTPGFEFLGLNVPINFDIYSDTLLNSINQIPLLGALGILDAQGEATATFVIPAGFPSEFAGLTLHHAYITADAVIQLPKFASNPVQVDLIL